MATGEPMATGKALVIVTDGIVAVTRAVRLVGGSGASRRNKHNLKTRQETGDRSSVHPNVHMVLTV